jgi:hypothetical protein
VPDRGGFHPAADAQLARDVRHVHAARDGIPVTARTREQIASFFGDLTLVEPGLVDVWAWRPDAELLVSMSDVLAGVRIGSNVVTSLGCVGRKDRPQDRSSGNHRSRGPGMS